VESIESDGGKVVARHSVVVVQQTSGQHEDDHATLLCYDFNAAALLVPARYLLIHDDLRTQPWYHPVPLSAHQAAIHLHCVNQPGCFVVHDKADCDEGGYQLALCVDTDVVLHYDIRQTSVGDYAIDGDRRRFLSVSDLVSYYQLNVGALATRLRRPLRDVACPPTAGRHFPADVELDRRRLQLRPNVVVGGGGGGSCTGDGGEAWAGVYDGRPVAVKVLTCRDASRTQQARLDDEFLSETTAMMGLRHDNIARLVGVCSASRPFLIVTEHRSNGTLKDHLRASLIPSQQAACSRRSQLLDIGVQVASAVEYLASQRYVLHRRVSSSSFVVDARSSQPLVKLTDFSRALRVSGDDSYTADGSELIFINHAAPEVLSQLHYSSRSDVWAVGVLLWQASTTSLTKSLSRTPVKAATL